MNCKNLFCFVIITIVILACSPALYKPTAADAEKTNVPLDTLIAGRILYINKCSSCHNLYLPEKYSSENWDTILPRMQENAKIGGSEINTIKKFLNARSVKKE